MKNMNDDRDNFVVLPLFLSLGVIAALVVYFTCVSASGQTASTIVVSPNAVTTIVGRIAITGTNVNTNQFNTNGGILNIKNGAQLTDIDHYGTLDILGLGMKLVQSGAIFEITNGAFLVFHPTAFIQSIDQEELWSFGEGIVGNKDTNSVLAFRSFNVNQFDWDLVSANGNLSLKAGTLITNPVIRGNNVYIGGGAGASIFADASSSMVVSNGFYFVMGTNVIIYDEVSDRSWNFKSDAAGGVDSNTVARLADVQSALYTIDTNIIALNQMVTNGLTRARISGSVKLQAAAGDDASVVLYVNNNGVTNTFGPASVYDDGTNVTQLVGWVNPGGYFWFTNLSSGSATASLEYFNMVND